MRLNSVAKAHAMHNLLPICISLVALRSVTAQWVANTQDLIIKEIEHLYLDAAPSGILSAITPCSNYYDPSTGGSNNNLGMNTAAEWIRTAFRMFLRFHRTLSEWYNCLHHLLVVSFRGYDVIVRRCRCAFSSLRKGVVYFNPVLKS